MNNANMFRFPILASGSLVLSALLALPPSALSQTTAFTYQGRLNVNGVPATGSYDIRFSLINTADGAAQILGVRTNSATTINNGLFTVTLDFGPGLFPGGARALEIAARTNGGGAFSTIVAAQPVNSTPYAITAGNLSGNLPASQLSGTIANSALPRNMTLSGTITAAAFAGDGAGLGNVNASSLEGMPSTGFWRTGGNAGTTPGANFLGTLDNQPLDLKVNGLRVLRLEPANDQNGGFVPNLIGGHQDNTVAPGITASVIGGGGGLGLSNTIASTECVIAGGFLNRIHDGNAHACAIGGGFDNVIQSGSARSVIAGGHANRIGAAAQGAAISGGENQVVADDAAWGAIGGGANNTVRGMAATISGGFFNLVQTGALHSVIAGGLANLIGTNSLSGVIGGGDFQVIANAVPRATIGGGVNNAIHGSASTIGGGEANTIESAGDHCTIAGGGFNRIAGDETFVMYATIAGGSENLIMTNAYYSAIGGGVMNVIAPASDKCFIGGGGGNRIDFSAQSVISGGFLNAIQSNAWDSVIAGGQFNVIRSGGDFSAIGGGRSNQVAATHSGIYSGFYNIIANGGQNSFIGGGQFNAISGPWATVAGGNHNTASGPTTSVAGGSNNQATETDATVGGGYDNTAGNERATVAGGAHNTASGYASTVPGGSDNSATGLFSFAAGYQAQANHDSSFVWSGRLAPAPSFAPARFQINARNGLGVDYSDQRPDGGGTQWIVIGSSGGQAISTSSGAWLSDGGVWNNASDRHRKDGFAEVNPREILDKLVALPIQTWHYTNETAGVRHLGPAAQDFNAHFGLGCDDKSIGTVDADGVALVAIQALNQKLEAELQRRDHQNAELQTLNVALQKRLERLEKLLPRTE